MRSGRLRAAFFACSATPPVVLETNTRQITPCAAIFGFRTGNIRLILESVMRHKTFQIGVCAVLILLVSTTTFAGDSPSATELFLHTFTGGADGSVPDGPLTLAGNGTFYGSTFFGGTANDGVVFKLSRTATGTRETVVYNFQGGFSDVQNPSGRLLVTKDGTIFGTAAGCEQGYGAVYKLTPSGTTYTETILHVFGGGWTKTVLHSFTNGADGGFVTSPVTLDLKGNIFGVTASGGRGGYGVAFAFMGLDAK